MMSRQDAARNYQLLAQLGYNLASQDNGDTGMAVVQDPATGRYIPIDSPEGEAFFNKATSNLSSGMDQAQFEGLRSNLGTGFDLAGTFNNQLMAINPATGKPENVYTAAAPGWDPYSSNGPATNYYFASDAGRPNFATPGAVGGFSVGDNAHMGLDEMGVIAGLAAISGGSFGPALAGATGLGTGAATGAVVGGTGAGIRSGGNPQAIGQGAVLGGLGGALVPSAAGTTATNGAPIVPATTGATAAAGGSTAGANTAAFGAGGGMADTGVMGLDDPFSWMTDADYGNAASPWSTSPSTYDLGGNIDPTTGGMMDPGAFDWMTPADYGDAVNPWSTNPSTADLGGDIDPATGMPRGLSFLNSLRGMLPSGLPASLGSALGGLSSYLPSAKQAASLAPGLLALAYARQQPGVDTSGLENTMSMADVNAPLFVQGAINPVQQNIAGGYGDLLQSQAARGIRGSSFGDASIGNYLSTTGRALGDVGATAAQKAIGLRGDLAGQIAVLKAKSQEMKNNLYGRAFDVLGRGLNPSGYAGNIQVGRA